MYMLPSALWLTAAAAAAAASAPQRIIVDTDMGFDVDDVGAVCLANSLHAAGLADVLAVVHNTGCKLGIGGVSAMNHFYGHDDIILGAWKGHFGSNCDKHYDGTFGQNQYLATVIRKTGGPIKDSSMVMTGTDAYRKALAAAPDGSVNVASIGMPTNLRDLLNTTADQYSTLSGVDLVVWPALWRAEPCAHPRRPSPPLHPFLPLPSPAPTLPTAL